MRQRCRWGETHRKSKAHRRPQGAAPRSKSLLSDPPRDGRGVPPSLSPVPFPQSSLAWKHVQTLTQGQRTEQNNVVSSVPAPASVWKGGAGDKRRQLTT